MYMYVFLFCVFCLLQDDDEPDKELALDVRIHKIKEQNKAIVKRKQEVEQDREKYG